MGGSWVAYVYVFVACGGVLALLGVCTAFLYLVARRKQRRGEVPARRVVSLTSSDASLMASDASLMASEPVAPQSE